MNRPQAANSFTASMTVYFVDYRRTRSHRPRLQPETWLEWNGCYQGAPNARRALPVIPFLTPA